MTYKNTFPGMSNFQRGYGAKGISGDSGIVPIARQMPVGAPISVKIKGFRKIFSKM